MSQFQNADMQLLRVFNLYMQHTTHSSPAALLQTLHFQWLLWAESPVEWVCYWKCERLLAHLQMCAYDHDNQNSHVHKPPAPNTQHMHIQCMNINKQNLKLTASKYHRHRVNLENLIIKTLSYSHHLASNYSTRILLLINLHYVAFIAMFTTWLSFSGDNEWVLVI